MAVCDSACLADLPPYQYAALPKDSYIRVAALQPYKELAEDPIVLETEFVYLDDAAHRPYDAISYVWGNKPREESVICGGRHIKVTATLLSALRDVRKPEAVVHIWADAICINQTDKHEREQQVSVMDRIFAEAARVLIHLGPLTACDQKAIALVTKFAQTDLSKIDVTQQVSLSAAHALVMDAVKDYDLPAVESDVWAALDSLMNKPWFTRLWVVQEYAVAQDIFFVLGQNDELLSAETFCLGTQTARWYHRILAFPLVEQLMGKGFTGLQTIALWIPHYSKKIGFYVPIFQKQKLIREVGSLTASTRLYAETIAFRLEYQSKHAKVQSRSTGREYQVGLGIDQRKSFGTPWWRYQEHTFFRHYVRTRQFAATDSRDRVYALRGLCSEKSIPELAVNYKESPWKLAERISVHLVERGHGVYLLTAMSTSTNLYKHGWRLSLVDRTIVHTEQLCRLVTPMGNFERTLFHAGGWDPQPRIVVDEFDKRPRVVVPGTTISRVVKLCHVELPELLTGWMQGHKAQQIGNSWWTGMQTQIRWYNDGVRWLDEIGRWIETCNSPRTNFELDCWRALSCGLTFSATGQRELIDSRPGQFDPGAVIMKCRQAYASVWGLFWRFMNQNVALPWVHITISYNLQLALDSDGRICTVPKGSQVGDQVCIFKGFPLPFVLRPPTPEARGTHQLLGAAYVQGAMDSDVFEERYRIDPQTFVLDPGSDGDDE